MNESTALLDAGALEALREMVGDEFVGELIGTFLADAPQLLVALRAAVEQGDVEEARRAAHTLKSNGATFGALDFTEICRELEERAKANDLAAAEQLVPRAEQEYRRVELALAAVGDGGGE